MVISLEDYEKLRLLLESGKATPKDIEVWGNIKEAVDGMFEYFAEMKPVNFKEQRELISSDFPAITNIFDVVFLPSLVRQKIDEGMNRKEILNSFSDMLDDKTFAHSLNDTLNYLGVKEVTQSATGSATPNDLPTIESSGVPANNDELSIGIGDKTPDDELSIGIGDKTPDDTPDHPTNNEQKYKFAKQIVVDKTEETLSFQQYFRDSLGNVTIKTDDITAGNANQQEGVYVTQEDIEAKLIEIGMKNKENKGKLNFSFEHNEIKYDVVDGKLSKESREHVSKLLAETATITLPAKEKISRNSDGWFCYATRMQKDDGLGHLWHEYSDGDAKLDYDKLDPFICHHNRETTYYNVNGIILPKAEQSEKEVVPNSGRQFNATGQINNFTNGPKRNNYNFIAQPKEISEEDVPCPCEVAVKNRAKVPKWVKGLAIAGGIVAGVAVAGALAPYIMPAISTLWMSSPAIIQPALHATNVVLSGLHTLVGGSAMAYASGTWTMGSSIVNTLMPSIGSAALAVAGGAGAIAIAGKTVEKVTSAVGEGITNLVDKSKDDEMEM